MASDAILNLARLPVAPPPIPKAKPMSTIADEIRAAKAQIMETRQGISTGVAAAVAETGQLAKRSAEEIAKLNAMNKELSDELAGLNGGEPL